MPEERTVLVIDDNAATRTLASAVLQRAGYRVTEAGDSASAVEELKKEFSVILLDFRMPHDGVAMIDYLADSLPHILARTILFLPSVNRPIWGVLSKPIEPGELVAAVTACAGQ